jgi:hypothetical protein
LGKHLGCGLSYLTKVGEFINADVDVELRNRYTVPILLKRKLGVAGVYLFPPEKHGISKTFPVKGLVFWRYKN